MSSIFDIKTCESCGRSVADHSEVVDGKTYCLMCSPRAKRVTTKKQKQLTLF